MISFIQAIILGLLEGITEFLPVSSTAHLILASEFFRLAQTEFVKSFEIIIQLGAILAVVFLYWRMLIQWEVLKRLALAFIPTGILGWAFYGIIKTYFIGNVGLVLWSLFLGGLILILFEKQHKEKKDFPEEIAILPYRKCFFIGLFQSVAMIPGVSRSAATIIGGLAIGLKRKTIVEFSFLLAVPTMLVATGFDFIKNVNSFSSEQAHVLAVGFGASFVMAILGIRFLLAYIQKNSFTFFGIYRIVAAVLFFLGRSGLF